MTAEDYFDKGNDAYKKGDRVKCSQSNANFTLC